jgi:hypothetical protein
MFSTFTPASLAIRSVGSQGEFLEGGTRKAGVPEG